MSKQDVVNESNANGKGAPSSITMVTTPESGAVVVLPPEHVTECNRLKKHYPDFDAKLAEVADLSDEALGNLQRPITKKMVEHGESALKQIADCRKLFKDNIAMFWDIKQRITNPRWRSDVKGNENRTAESNKTHFGACDWTEYREKYISYSQSQADTLLREFEHDLNGLSDGLVIASVNEAAAETAQKNGKSGSGRTGKIDAQALKNAYYADRYKEVIALVTNKPKDTKPEELLALIEANAVCAYEDMDADEAKSLRVPKPQRTKVEKMGIVIAKVIARNVDLGRKLPRSSSIGWKLYDRASDLLKAVGEEVKVDAKVLEAAGKPKSVATCKSMGIPFEIDPNLVNETISTLTAVAKQLPEGELETRVRILRNTLIQRTDGSGVTPKVIPPLGTPKVNGKGTTTPESGAVEQSAPSQAAETIANKDASVIVMGSRRSYEKNELTVKKGSIFVIGHPELGAIDTFEGEDANNLAWAEVERLTQPAITAAAA